MSTKARIGGLWFLPSDMTENKLAAFLSSR